MIRQRWVATAGLIGAFLALATVALAAPATPVAPAATPASPLLTCPLTEPSGNNPAGYHDPGGYGNDVLWSTLLMWGMEPGIVIVPNGGRITPDGAIQPVFRAASVADAVVPGR